MLPTRTRTGSGPNRGRQSREVKHSRLALFIQQFVKEAQERMNELEAKLDNTLATVDKMFKVELLKTPPSLQSTLMGDLLSEGEIAASDVSIAMKNECLQMQQPLKRGPSKRVKSTDSAPAQRVSSKSSKAGNGTKGARALVSSNSTGNLRGSTATAQRTQSCLSKNETKPKLRSVVSTGDLHCSMAHSAAHITVTTARGQTVSFSEETKDEINLDLLDDVAWCQIQKLTSLMECMSRRNRFHR